MRPFGDGALLRCGLKAMGEEIKAGRIPVDEDDKDEKKEPKRSGKGAEPLKVN